MYSPIDHVTTQGYDMQFGTNVLGGVQTNFAAVFIASHASNL